jgi:class 3 adenylate cyclase
MVRILYRSPFLLKNNLLQYSMSTFSSLPTGTVTFLFTDIEGSTQLLHRLGAEYTALLAEQREILRSVFERWRGQEVDTQGDAFFVAFQRASDAVEATIDAQRNLAAHAWPEGEIVLVRMGLHTGRRRASPMWLTAGKFCFPRPPSPWFVMTSSRVSAR